MYIVMLNAQGSEVDRKQVFHNETLGKAMTKFVESVYHIIEPGAKFEIVENDD